MSEKPYVGQFRPLRDFVGSKTIMWEALQKWIEGGGGVEMLCLELDERSLKMDELPEERDG